MTSPNPVQVVCEKGCGYVVWVEPFAIEIWTECDFCGAPTRKVEAISDSGTPFFVDRTLDYVCLSCRYDPSLEDVKARRCPQCASYGCLYVYTMSDYFRCPNCGSQGPDSYAECLQIDGCPQCGYSVKAGGE